MAEAFPRKRRAGGTGSVSVGSQAYYTNVCSLLKEGLTMPDAMEIQVERTAEALRCGVALGSAREQVRVAKRLGELPLVREAFAHGRLSYSKVRAISRVASAASEAELLELALHATAAQLERIVRAYRGAASADLEQANTSYAERYLSCSWDDDGSLGDPRATPERRRGAASASPRGRSRPDRPRRSGGE